MSHVFPLWWLALPVLLLPIWWHRQRRRRLQAEPLASARFLPASEPRLLRVWRWTDRLLLLIRCLLLVGVLAWLADSALAWRGDTVLLDAGADAAWAEREIEAAGFKDARRIALCQPDCPDLFAWLRQHEREWRADARLLVVARASQAPMPAIAPRFAHQVALRVAPPVPVAGTRQVHIALATTPAREAAWRAMFTAFDKAGDGRLRHRVAAAPNAQTELIVWDRPEPAPADWRAPLWWTAHQGGIPVTVNGITLRYADSPRGRLWESAAWPARDAAAARAIFDTWQALHYAPVPYAAPSQALAVAGSPAVVPSRALASQLLVALLVLLALERILSHARRG